MTTRRTKHTSSTASDTPPIRNLTTEYGLACPDCGAAERLTIVVSCSATLSIEGTEIRDDHDWDDASSCYCDDCGLNGTVGEFRVADGKAVQA